MSLGIVIKGTEGIVLAADSRVTLLATLTGAGPNRQLTVPATFDNATKLLRVNHENHKHVAAVTFGLGAIGATEPRTASSFMPEFEAELVNEKRLKVETFSEKLSEFFVGQWKALKMPSTIPPGNDMVFLVGGYDKDAAYGNVFSFSVPSDPKPRKLVPDQQFGAYWGGQREYTDRLIQGFDPNLPNVVQEILGIPQDKRDAALDQKLKAKLTIPIPWQFLPLQDCVDLATLIIKTTIALQKFVIGVRGVGGAVDVATITRTVGFEPVQVKKITAEKAELN
jgi:hypothetical protein